MKLKDFHINRVWMFRRKNWDCSFSVLLFAPLMGSGVQLDVMYLPDYNRQKVLCFMTNAEGETRPLHPLEETISRPKKGGFDFVVGFYGFRRWPYLRLDYGEKIEKRVKKQAEYLERVFSYSHSRRKERE